MIDKSVAAVSSKAAVISKATAASEQIKSLKQALLSAWNDRMIQDLALMYRHTVRLFFGPGTQLYGRDALISALVDIHAAFPDLEFSIDGIAADNPEDQELRVFISWTMRGTHLGFGRLGAPTGNRMMLTGASLYHLSRGTITEIREAADNGSLLNQLKIDEDYYIQRTSVPKPYFDLQMLFGDTERTSGQDQPDQLNNPDFPGQPELLNQTELKNSINQQLTNLIKTIWNSRSPGVISGTHHEGCKYTLPAGFLLQRSLRHADIRQTDLRQSDTMTIASRLSGTIPDAVKQDCSLYQAFVYSMLAMLPDARAYIDEIILDERTLGNLSESGDPPSLSTSFSSAQIQAAEGYQQPPIYAAVRWTLQGVHSGEGYLGLPADRQVTIPLISEYQIKNGKVVSERIFLSELDLRKKSTPIGSEHGAANGRFF